MTSNTEQPNLHRIHLFNALTQSQACIEFDLNGNVMYANQNFLNVFGYSEEEVLGKHHSLFALGRWRNRMNTGCSGTNCARANFKVASFCDSIPKAGKFISRRATTRCEMTTAIWCRYSKSHPISRWRKASRLKMRAKWLRSTNPGRH